MPLLHTLFTTEARGKEGEESRGLAENQVIYLFF